MPFLAKLLKWMRKNQWTSSLEKCLKLHSGDWVKTQLHGNFFHIWTSFNHAQKFWYFVFRPHFDAVWIFPQKCAPSVGRNRPMTRSLKKTQKVKANAQGYSHLPTHLMVSIDRYENYLSKKVSLGTQIFILCQIWQLEKQFYEKVNKFWLVSYEIEEAATYEKSHSVVPN